ncbi:MAG TPA: gamma-butyrobetaine dioxygenase [Gammaproteobacteria bacterium]|nr:gamma-butyrobetaine dioxygenase [Gammaproteobacteria bacterium]
MNPIQRFRFDRDKLSITWTDGGASELQALWLRDHCQMPASRNLANGQRLLNITDIPLDIGIADASLDGHRLVIEFTGDGHRSEFDLDWLRNNCYCLNQAQDDRSEARKTLWDKQFFDDGLPRCHYADFCNRPGAQLAALRAVRDLGFVVLDGVDCESGEILRVIKQFGFVRETNYGPLFDVRTTVDPTNLAFTNLGLGCHLDNPYRDPVPGLQLLHCLESSTTGGESILQDGFMAAGILRLENPAHFELLSRNWINFRFRDGASDLQARVPFIEVNDHEQVIKVRFNNRSIDTLKLPPAIMREFYPAYRHYAEILEREELQVVFKLQPGELMLFDNTRILHARKAYSATGTRHLQGAYSDLDGLYSSLRRLESNA